MAISQNEEDYLKAILHLQLTQGKDLRVSTNAIAKSLGIQAASVTEMMKKLASAGLIEYEKYQGVSLSKKGWQLGSGIIRKHRLWETFLVEKLGYDWADVHVIAEQLEHVQSDTLINKLDEFLGFPRIDPHGDPIPDQEGTFPLIDQIKLSSMRLGEVAQVSSVSDDSASFLAYLQHLKINIGTSIETIAFEQFDRSIEVLIDGKKQRLSAEVAECIMVRQRS